MDSLKADQLEGFQRLDPHPISAEPVAGITSDSRKVLPGYLFVALIGTTVDGHQYLSQAIQQGAIGLIVSSERVAKGLVSNSLLESVPVWAVKDTYQAYAALCHHQFGEPGSHLRILGVTGTNGKTTVTHLLEQMLLDQGEQVGLIGTLGQRRAKQVSQNVQQNNPEDTYASTGHTTPMAGELHAILAEMVTDEVQSVVMEISSHALEQHRVFGCDIEVAVFTNLTQDHLDYHKTMDHYRDAKALLFQNLKPGPPESNKHPRSAVVNMDDPYGPAMLAACPEGVQQLTYGIDTPHVAIRAKNITYSIQGSIFQVETPQGEAPVHLKLGGQFSIYNALAALGAGLAYGISLEDCVRSLEAVSGIRGRFEVVSHQPFVIVDYAHTPDGLQNVLQAAREVTPEGGRLISVFGCGGDRDATKRPKMGRIAESLSDVLVVTSDNPRTEDPQQILTDILSGIQRFDPKTMTVEPDRQLAIHHAIDVAQPSDVIVVAGKGHEDYQILATETIHFDDREVVQTYVTNKQELSV